MTIATILAFGAFNSTLNVLTFYWNEIDIPYLILFVMIIRTAFVGMLLFLGTLDFFKSFKVNA